MLNTPHSLISKYMPCSIFTTTFQLIQNDEFKDERMELKISQYHLLFLLWTAKIDITACQIICQTNLNTYLFISAFVFATFFDCISAHTHTHTHTHAHTHTHTHTHTNTYTHTHTHMLTEFYPDSCRAV